MMRPVNLVLMMKRREFRATMSETTHQTYTNILESRMIQIPRRAVVLPLIIHRRQYLKTRSSLKLFPDPATYMTRLCETCLVR